MEEQLPSSVKYNLTTHQKDDCAFVFETKNGSKEKVGAKKQFFIASSEPFRRMLEESPLAEQGDVHLEDVKVETFKNLLKWVYGGGETVLSLMSVEEQVDLLYVAEKYLFVDLKPKVVSLIADRLSLNNIFYVLRNPVCLQVKGLEEDISDFICMEVENVLKNECFLLMSSEVVLWILKQTSLNISEVILWETLVKWAKKVLKTDDGKELRKHLREHLKHIRFGSMSCREFNERVVTTDILLPEEVVKIIKFSCADETIQQGSLIFEPRPRKKILGKNKCSSVFNNIIPANFEESYRSQTFKVGDLKYCFQLKKNEDYLSFFLIRLKPVTKLKTSFTCKMVLINQSGRENVSAKFSVENYDADNRVYGKFVEINTILNPKNGFIKNNCIIVMVELKVTDIVK